MKVSAQLNQIRIAPRKARLVANLIVGLDVDEALYQMEAQVKRTSPKMKKLLESAIANAENNFGLDRSNLYVERVLVNAGPTLKRWMPKAYGRAGEILKRTSQIMLTLEERIEGKGRKTQAEMEKIKKEREKVRREAEKAMAKDDSEETKKDEDKKEISKKGQDQSTKKGSQGNWGSRIFRRKSM